MLAPSLHRVTLDWLTFRTKASPFEVVEVLNDVFDPHGTAVERVNKYQNIFTLQKFVSLGETKKGMDGFLFGASIMFGPDESIGRMDWGGDTMRGWLRVNITGEGCGLLYRTGGIDRVELFQSLERSEVKRIDHYLDTRRGESSIESARAAAKVGGFNNGGKDPKFTIWADDTNPENGETFYIGTRGGAIYMRVYRKGAEVLAKLRMPSLVGMIDLDGTPSHLWVRNEVERRAVDGRPLSWDMVLNPDPHFAGAYPYCRHLLDDIEPAPRVLSQKILADAAEAHTKQEIKRQWGAALFTMLSHNGGDLAALMAELVGNKHSDKLLASYAKAAVYS